MVGTRFTMGTSQESWSPEQEKPTIIKSWKERNWISKMVSEEGLLIDVRMREGFDVASELEKRRGSTIEIAGPTDTGYPFHLIKEKDIERVDLFEKRKVFVSNLYPGAPEFDSNTEQFQHFEGIVDFIADAKKLPLKENAVGAIFCSCLGGMGLGSIGDMLEARAGDKVLKSEKSRFFRGEESSKTLNIALRRKTLEEAWRVLAPNGLLIWKGGFREDVASAVQAGFTILQNEVKVSGSNTGESVYNLILLKGADKN